LEPSSWERFILEIGVVKRHSKKVASPVQDRRGPQFVAVGFTVAFILFTVWWLIDGGAGLDGMTLRLGDWLLQGLIDEVVGDTWVLGEPQVALAIVVVLAVFLVTRRRYRAMGLIVGGFLVLSAAQLTVFVAVSEVHHIKLGVDALSHLYPSGHTARVPFLGTAVAVIAARSARGWILAGTTLLAVAVALDRTSSGVQTGSVVVGGLLLGIAVSAWFATLYSEWGRGSMSERTHPKLA
jgi:PAP2 superfamily